MSTIIPSLIAAKRAAKQINVLDNNSRVALTAALAQAIRENIPAILKANLIDLEKIDPAAPFYDRLLLTHDRLTQMADATAAVSQLPDPTGQQMSAFEAPNGLNIKKVTVPLGLVGAIYEARPNVTIDIAALCLRSGNGVVLKGGTDAAASNAALVKITHAVLHKAGLPAEAVTLLPNDRSHLAELLTATAYVDVIVPRGSQALINYVRSHATVPTIETGAGVCHTYVERSAQPQQAAAIVVNAKTQRPSVCNALDTVLVDRHIAADFLPLLIPGFTSKSVGIYADADAYAILSQHHYPHLHPAQTEDFGREYLSQNCSVKIVDGLEEALDHIAEFSSKHSEAIVTENEALAQRFLTEVDAAAVYHNASTRFTDGGVFGLGAELGISTQKLHARGPFALEKLVCEKWLVLGTGQIR
ncbi:MAG: glutamate-5-semialdehyde dehydrogenase [Bacteroidetes bacterium]|nr:MAG: glutamate-5-semialdehyde dehydrogenase [Bacteroidota bacterium]